MLTFGLCSNYLARKDNIHPVKRPEVKRNHIRLFKSSSVISSVHNAKTKCKD